MALRLAPEVVGWRGKRETEFIRNYSISELCLIDSYFLL
jgi:hypothetical protein